MIVIKLLFTALLWRQAQSQTTNTTAASDAVVVDDGTNNNNNSINSSTNNTDNNQTETQQQQSTNNDVIIYPRHLTFEELQLLISSEIGVEYNYYYSTDGSANNNIEKTLEETLEEDWESTITESTWNASIQYEWSKALSAEKEKDGSGSGSGRTKYPYLICHTGINMSGYQRRVAIVDALTNNYTTATTPTANTSATVGGQEDTTAQQQQPQQQHENEIYLHTLYNENDYLCVYGQLYPSSAITLANEEFVVQPVLPSLKMIKGVVEGIQMEFRDSLSDDTAEGYFPIVDVHLCPGVATTTATAAVGALGGVGESGVMGESSSSGKKDEFYEHLLQMNGMKNGTNTTTSTTTTTVQGGDSFDDDGDFMGSDVEDITEAITNMLLSNSSTTLPLSQQFYMTSDAYLAHLNSTDGGGNDVQNRTARSKMWGELLDEYQSSGICDATYMTRLTWKIYRSTQPDRSSSQMHVVYNNTGESETDSGCALVLLLGIASNPDVCSVDVRRGVQTSNRIASFMVESEIEAVTPFTSRSINGTGVTVAVSDTGVDHDNCYFYDPDQPLGSVSAMYDSSSRKIDQYVPYADTDDYQYGHGTHVAGTIAGKRWDGSGLADGVAVGAKLVVADIGNDRGDLLPPNDKALLSTGRPYAQIHSASWGSEFNYYTSRARNFDQYMFENDEFLIIIAAGNTGSNDNAYDIPNTVGDPATAKNVISVGAHNSWGYASPVGDLGPSYIADFSSRGPTADGRMKPDIVAVGKTVLSAGARPDQVGECDPSRIPGPNSKSEGLLSLQGTSMATPVVTGTAALIRQYFADGYYPSGTKKQSDAYPNPSGALVKAVLMNGAQNLKGVDNGVHGVTDIKLYDNNQGFGRISLQDSVYLAGETNVQLQMWDREIVIDQYTNTYDVTIDKSKGCQAEDLSVTLVWVEEGGSPGCMFCVINDLDLSVSFRNKTYYPNGLSNPDRTNIVERVVISGVQDGETATISVTANNLAWATQKYALVATGCFGGVENTLQGKSVFDYDNSQQRRQVIIIAVCVAAGLLLLGCIVAGLIRRRKARSGAYLSEEPV